MNNKQLDVEKEIGKKYYRLTILKFIKKVQTIRTKDGRKSGYQYYFLCKCDCGNKKVINFNRLKRGGVKSCGCLNKEQVKIMQNGNIAHGLSDNRIYNIWKQIKQRCNNKNSQNYNRYGGRGIKICAEWNNNVKIFYEWAIKNGYKDNLSIDRIDNNGDYEPNNCRWTNAKTQARNTRSNKLVTYKGETHCLSEWAEKLNMSYDKLWSELFKYKWSFNRVITNIKDKK